MKKLSVLLALIFVLIMAPMALADTIDTQFDIGKFDCWMYSDGQSWQNVPGYGLVKPFDKPSITYTVTYSGSNLDKITGVKSVTFFSGDEIIYNKTARSETMKYEDYTKSEFCNYAVKELVVDSFKYLGDGRVEITITPTLDTYTIETKHSDYPGRYVHEDFQGKLTQGRRFYTPAVIEWEMADAAPDFWPSVPILTYTGVPGSTITIPTEVWNSGEKKDTTDFISWWDGESWDNKVGYYDNLTLGYGEKADTPVTVTVPTATKTLWFRCNIDNNTPVGESDLTNNALAVTVGPNTADVGVSISVDTTKPKRDCGVTATVYATNHGPATADVHLVIGENNGTDQVIDYYDEDEYTFTLAPGASKKLIYESGGYSEGHSIYLATKADVTNTTDPNLANNFARTQRITWQAPAPPPVVPPSETNSSLIH
jgi:hypothetical protein